jgi:hypothetical protein
MRSRREMPLLRYCLMSSFIVVLPQFRSDVGFFDVTLAHAFNRAHQARPPRSNIKPLWLIGAELSLAGASGTAAGRRA